MSYPASWNPPEGKEECKVFYSKIAPQILILVANANMALHVLEEASAQASLFSTARENCFLKARCSILAGMIKFLTGPQECEEDEPAEPCTQTEIREVTVWVTVPCD